MGNLVLTGFMGTGKTAVGREVARRLGRRFVDMDAEIEARAGKSIPRVFAEDGEETFRRMEAVLCQELSAQDGLVIASGGGTLVDPANRASLLRSGTVVCLTCDVDEILRRLREGPRSGRPLLNVADPRAEVERLLEARRPAYAAIPWQVDTTRLSVEQVAARVVEIVNGETRETRFFGKRSDKTWFLAVQFLAVHHPGGEYSIIIGDGLLAHVGDLLGTAGVPEGGRVAVVSNPVVAPLYGGQVEAALRSAGWQPFACTVPDGEEHKTPATVARLYEQFLAGGLDREGTVLALGGGVTGDAAGFAAATFMRGVRLVQVPTTLLAMVDSSAGGKTGVNLPQGKNLVGAFKQPALVAIDPTVLATLPVEEARSGMAELIKHAVIGDAHLFAELEAAAGESQIRIPQSDVSHPPHYRNLHSPFSILHSHIVRALRVKIAIVEEDPLEQDRRAVLNLGHTVGHALEQLSGFRLRHGEAVGIGIAAAVRLATKLGRAAPALVDRIERALVAWGLPVTCPPFAAGEIWEAMAHDKKRRRGALRWVLPRAIGEVEIVEDVPREVVEAVLYRMGATGK